MKDKLTIGTRGSALALVQTHWVRDSLQSLFPNLDIHVLIIQTQGDVSQATNTPLSSYSDKGIFAKEIEVALLEGDIDIAVHSMKDLASSLPPGLHIGAVPERQDVRDAVIGVPLLNLPPNGRVGTGSVRRRALLQEMRSDLRVVDIRGNVDTRIKKLKNGDYDSIVLAVAGLNRLGRAQEIAQFLDPHIFVPDPGQGALAIEVRVEDGRINELIAPLNHADSSLAVAVERSFLEAVGGGCETPVGAWASVVGDNISFTVMAAFDDTQPRREHLQANVSEADGLGRKAAELFLN